MKLVLALYGHADAGGFWEAHCQEKLLSIGWKALAEEWQGVFWHEATRSMLIVYVDDFKLAAKPEHHNALWKSIRSVIDMDPETVDGRFLGCSHDRFTTTAKHVSTMLDNHPSYHPRPKLGASAAAGGTPAAVEPVAKIYDPNRTVSVVSYNMELFATDCVNVFCELSGFDKAKVGTAPTPFIDEANDPLLAFEGLDTLTPSPGGVKEEEEEDQGCKCDTLARGVSITPLPPWQAKLPILVVG